MAKKVPGRVSGFPEWLPEVRRIEQHWLDIARQVFESHGFASIEPASVEEVSVIEAKGEDVDKEIYALSRLNADPNERASKKDPRLALHFDLTVPMARYVAQNYNDLTFPFKRYQIQKAWRGERPQEGRFREFTQADIDIIDNNTLSKSFDSEMPRILFKIFDRIGLKNIQTNINNRKIIQGYYEGLGIEDRMSAIRIVDKIDKIGGDGVAKLLIEELGCTSDQAEACLKLATIKTHDDSFADQVRALGIKNEMLEEGLDELSTVMRALSDLPRGSVTANLSIARGLDYYTGIVYEGRFLDYPDFPTIYAGGRYENLVGSYLNRDLPGVGISIGITRILSKMLSEGRLNILEQSPSDVLLIRFEDSDEAELTAKAEMLRDKGLNVEIYHEAAKLGNQIKYADRKSIPYVLFIASEKQAHDEIKDITSGEQKVVNLADWMPDHEKDNYRTRFCPSETVSILDTQ